MRSFGFLTHASLNSALATYTLGANVENLVLLAAPSPGHSAAAPYLPLEGGGGGAASDINLAQRVTRVCEHASNQRRWLSSG